MNAFTNFQLPQQQMLPPELNFSNIPQGMYSPNYTAPPNMAAINAAMMQQTNGLDMSAVNRGMTNPLGMNTNTGTGTGGNWSEFLLGNNQQVGALPVGLGLLNTGLNLYTGIKGLQMAEDQFNFQKDAFNKNYANQTKLINSQLRDRQRARYAANPHAYQSPDEYMAENKVGE